MEDEVTSKDISLRIICRNIRDLEVHAVTVHVTNERVAEWLRRLTRKPKVRTAVGSNPTLDSLVAVFFFFFFDTLFIVGYII